MKNAFATNCDEWVCRLKRRKKERMFYIAAIESQASSMLNLCVSWSVHVLQLFLSHFFHRNDVETTCAILRERASIRVHVSSTNTCSRWCTSAPLHVKVFGCICNWRCIAQDEIGKRKDEKIPWPFADYSLRKKKSIMIRFILSSTSFAVIGCNPVVFACALTTRFIGFFSVCAIRTTWFGLFARNSSVYRNAFFVILFIFFWSLVAKKSTKMKNRVLWRGEEKAETIFFSIKAIFVHLHRVFKPFNFNVFSNFSHRMFYANIKMIFCPFFTHIFALKVHAMLHFDQHS